MISHREQDRIRCELTLNESVIPIKRQLTLSLLLSFLLGLLLAAPAYAQGALEYQYKLRDGKTLTYTFSNPGIRMDLTKGKVNQNTFIYQKEKDALVTLDAQSKKAVKFTRSFLNQTIERIRQVRSKLQQQIREAPPGQRKMMRKMLKNKMPNYKDPEPVNPPEVTLTDSIQWNGLSARKGSLKRNDESVGTIILLDEPPLTITGGARESIKKFQSFMKLFTKMTRAARQTRQYGNSLLNTENLFGPRHFRLAELESQSRHLELTDWNTRSTPNNFFSVPDDYELTEPSPPKQGS